MRQAKNTPVTSTKELHTEDLEIAHKSDIDLTAGLPRGESLANPVGEAALNKEFLEELAFMEDPITIRIEAANSNQDYPETHVPCQVGNQNGTRGAEILVNGKWIQVTWLPVGEVITTKRKYADVLIRSIADTIRTVHDDATVERPRNTVSRRSSSQYPITIIEDSSPKGVEWARRARLGL